MMSHTRDQLAVDSTAFLLIFNLAIIEQDKMSFSDSQLCLQFSKHVADTIFIIKVALGSVGVLASLLVILLIGVMKVYKQFVYRLVLYLMAVNALQALFQILELIPIQVTENDYVLVRNSTGWQEVCSVVGYLDIGVVWMGNLVIIWTMLYMLSLSWQLHRLQASNHNETQQGRTRVCEIIGVLFVILSPFSFNWIPFVVHMYGPSDFMCWIKTVGKNGCGNSKIEHWSIALMMVMFYGPIVAIVTFGLVCLVAIILLLHRTSKHLHGGIRQRYQSSMKEMGMLLVYPIIYCIFCSIMLGTRIYAFVHTSTTDGSPYYPLWILHSVADPGRIVLPALAFLLHPYVWKTFVSRFRSGLSDAVSSYTKFSVPPEDSDMGEGITIEPTGDDYGSVNSRLFFKKPQ